MSIRGQRARRVTQRHVLERHVLGGKARLLATMEGVDVRRRDDGSTHAD